MATVTETTLRKILANAKIRPFKVSYYCEKRAPDFDSKMHDVLVIYKQVSLQFDETGNLKPFEGVPVHTLSYDEKPGMQALDTTTEDRPPVPDTDKNSTIYWDYEYVRLGTLSLLAAIDLLTGEAIPLVSDTHKSSDFVCFLKMLGVKYPEGDKIRLILDNHSAHTLQETQEYLNTVPGRPAERKARECTEAVAKRLFSNRNGKLVRISGKRGIGNSAGCIKCLILRGWENPSP